MSTGESPSEITKASPMRKPTPAHEELQFVARTSKRGPQSQRQNRSSGSLSGVTVIVVIAGLVAVLFVTAKSKTNYAPRTASAASPVEAVEPVTVNPARHGALPQLPDGIRQRLIQPGTLAITSPTAVDIFLDDRFVGTAPIKLNLPAGTQKVEYRHLGMRKVVTHDIKSNDTTAAMITFDIPVQINAKPWAQVSIDGSQRQPLGQTPLSVRVPIGSILIFENPNFPSKTYQVTDRESEIRVSFP